MDTTDTGSNSNNNTNGNSSIPLRASCDRCRAHKLRCVPSSTSDTKAPCQRCVKAAVPDACVFGRTGRYRKISVDHSAMSNNTNTTVTNNTNNNINHQNQSHTNNTNKPKPNTRDRNASFTRGTTPVFPGMGTFVLPTPPNSSRVSYKDGPSTGSEPPHAIDYSNDQRGALYPSSTTNIDDVLDMFPDSWERESLINSRLPALNDYSRQSSDLFMFGANPIVTECEDNSRSGSSSRMEPSLMSMPPTPQSGFATDFLSHTNLNLDATSTKPGALNELAVLLSEMPLYEERLVRHAHGNLLTYPIGDAIFLTLRFRAILAGRIDLSSSPGEENMPAMLLTLSCYMTLVTIYLTIFNYFATNLSMILAGSDARHNKSNHSCTADRYRGLRLDQLQPICLCAGWNPIKKAVLMLLCSLSCTEAILGLPIDARVTVKPPEEFRVAHEVWFEAGEEKCVIFDEALMATLMNSGLYQDSKRKTLELRDKVKEVEGLVVGVSEMYAVSP